MADELEKTRRLVLRVQEMSNDFDRKLAEANKIALSSPPELVLRKLELTIELCYDLTSILSYLISAKYQLQHAYEASGSYQMKSYVLELMKSLKEDADKYKSMSYTLSDCSKSVKEIYYLKTGKTYLLT